MIFMLMLCFELVGLSRAEPIHYAATNLWQAEVGHNNQSSPDMDSNDVI
jgi:hypothetical protein